jgi:hypothetical protein
MANKKTSLYSAFLSGKKKPVIISIDTPLPDKPNQEEVKKQAIELEEILYDSIPSSLYDYLFYLMASRFMSSFPADFEHRFRSHDRSSS